MPETRSSDRYSEASSQTAENRILSWEPWPSRQIQMINQVFATGVPANVSREELCRLRAFYITVLHRSLAPAATPGLAARFSRVVHSFQHGVSTLLHNRRDA